MKQKPVKKPVPRTGTKKEKVIGLYKQGKLAPEIIKLTKYGKNTVEGAINHFRNEEGLAYTGKYYNENGNLVIKPLKGKAEKPAPVKKKKKVVAKKKKKAAPKKKKAAPAKAAKASKPVKKKEEKLVDTHKPGAGTKVAVIPEDTDEEEEEEQIIDDAPIIRF